MPATLFTRWGREVDPEHVLMEYPRPGMVRNSYLNLNGYWDYAITGSGILPEHYEGKILVPFSPEAPLSGVNRQLKPDDFLHYRRIFTAEKNGSRWLLHFGAVDQSCEVYLNQHKAGSHSGGYLPFTLDVTELIADGENCLQLVVKDLSDTSFHSRGKQCLERGGMWYTAQSGIWQTVWAEQVPDHYITKIKVMPDFEKGQVELEVASNDQNALPVHVEISFQGKRLQEADFDSAKKARIVLNEFMSWTPETPYLYDMMLSMGEDRVSTYFAMRKIERKKDRNGILRFFLNGKPYFHQGLLDQGYYPDGLYTAPSDEAMVYDILKMKELGFNMLRKHIKIEPDRWYYHCDRIGMLVWQDMVCGGEKYHPKFVTIMPNVLPWTGRVISDRHYGWFSRKNEEGRKEYLTELEETISLLDRHPSIVAWVPFNEGWGQFDAKEATALVRKLDPGRLIDEASGWFDQGGGDMYSIHNYFRKLKVRPEKERVIALTECGGYSLLLSGHSFCEEEYGYRRYTSKEDLTNALAALWEKELIPNISRGLSAVVYTQLSDVEDEVNGLVTYDRECVKVDEEKMREMNRRIFRAFLEACG